MPLGNGDGEIAIMDTSNPALPWCAYGASVQVIADAVGLKIRGVPGIPQHRTEGVRDANGPVSKKPKPVYTTITHYVTGEKACYDPEDMHANTCTRVCSTIFLEMSRIRLISIYGDLTLNIKE
jgi:hypothetical protein